MKKVALVFPGQGSQVIGMGKDVFHTYDRVKDCFHVGENLLGYPILDLMFNGPEEELTKTENAQPALLLTSIGILRELEAQGVQATVTAGHSLGEYSAMVAAGAISFEEALPLVHERGKLMEKAFPSGKGAMAAVLGLNAEEIQTTLEQINAGEEIVDIANYNCPGQIVISGTKQGVQRASEFLKDKGAKRVIELNVSGPFHSRLMKPASESFSEVLQNIKFQDSNVPVVMNVSANASSKKEELQDALERQLYSPVQWEETIRSILDMDVDAIVEVGSGKVLSGLVRKVERRMKTFSVQDTDSLNEFINWYKED
ncbi:ACP S-malonyltransferase [Bacillaceae bacterium S4-13-58]